MTHNPTPWRRLSSRSPWIVDANGELVCEVGSLATEQGLFHPSPLPGNTERIIACVNACQGWTTEELSARTFLKTGQIRLASLADNARAPLTGERVVAEIRPIREGRDKVDFTRGVNDALLESRAIEGE